MIVFFPYKKRIRSISPCDTGTGFAVTFSLRDKKVRPQRNAAVAVSEENKRGNLYLSSDVLSAEDFLYGGCHFVGSFLFLRFRKIEMAAGVAGDHFRSLLSNFCSHPRSSVRDGPARFPPVRHFFRRHNPTPAAPAAFARPPGCSRRPGVKAWRPGSRGLLRVRLRPARPTRPSPGTAPSGSAPSLQRHSPSPPGPAGSRCPSPFCPRRVAAGTGIRGGICETRWPRRNHLIFNCGEV